MGGDDVTGWPVREVGRVRSSNDLGRELIAGGERGPVWLRADEQTAGRGRLGRSWHSPPGNLYATLIVSPGVAMEHASTAGFVAGVAIVAALQRMVPGGCAIRLKWPNDVLVDGAKLAGILVDAAGTRERPVLAIGMGVNLVSAPQVPTYATVALGEIVGPEATPAPGDLLAGISAQMEACWPAWQAAGFTAIRAQWLAHAAGIGEAVCVRLPGGGRLDGRFDTIDERGALLVRTPDGIVPVSAGDVVTGRAATEAD